LKKELLIISEHTIGRGRTPYPTLFTLARVYVCFILVKNN
jgi:hypothetical protein